MNPLLAALLLVNAMVLYDVPSWTVGIDSRTTDQWLAEAPGSVFAINRGNLVAIDTATGEIRWKSPLRPQGAPAVTHGALAVATDRGLAFLDPARGSTRRVLTGVGATSLAGSPSTIVAFNSHTSELCAFSASGVRHWCRELGTYYRDGTVFGLGGNLVAVSSNAGWVFFDAANGRAVASAADADTLVGSDGRYVWFTVREGGIKGLDLDTNRTFVMHNQIERGQVIAEHQRAVAVIGGHLTLIDLQTRQSSPLHIDGRWIGGPVDGKIFIERGDGLYLQSIEPGAKAVRVAAYNSEARYVTSDRSTGYVGLRNGTVLVIDLEQDKLLHKYATTCDFYEGVTASGATTVVHCDSGTQSRLVGFSRER